MRLYLLLAALTGLTFFSCEKNKTVNTISPDLGGRWRMVLVKDISDNTIATKPISINGEVEIIFSFSTLTTGVITGVTPTNYLDAAYTIDPSRRLSVPVVSMTKIRETTWGLYFIDNITFSKDYFFDMQGRLNINTTTEKILVFTRQ